MIKDASRTYGRIFKGRPVDESEQILLDSSLSIDTLVEMRFKKRSGWIVDGNKHSRHIGDDTITIFEEKKKYIVKINGVFVLEHRVSYKNLSQIKLAANDLWKENFEERLKHLIAMRDNALARGDEVDFRRINNGTLIH